MHDLPHTAKLEMCPFDYEGSSLENGALQHAVANIFLAVLTKDVEGPTTRCGYSERAVLYDVVESTNSPQRV